ncbi:MAG TPA: class I SAM-dependent methyltransferase [Pyrinomonadaceae bacterium]
MKPTETGKLYDKISSWWNDQQDSSTAGINFVQRAIRLTINKDNALDVGCGSGGRIVTALRDAGFKVTGIDVSEAMLEFARKRHPDSDFILGDICQWKPLERYDLIIAWDSSFHLPHLEQRPVTGKLCEALADGGVILFTAGGVDGEITGQMCGLDFYYSSLAETDYLEIMKGHGCKCILMERDQHPEEHVVFIGTKV